MFAEQLAYLGWSPVELRQMLAVNPRAFLGLDNDQADSPAAKES
jgi:hypothetical protein